jgi:tetratricopeptide (TPR) repeat protein
MLLPSTRTKGRIQAGMLILLLPCFYFFSDSTGIKTGNHKTLSASPVNQEQKAPLPPSIPSLNNQVNPEEKGETYAIIIGISKYKNIGSLRYADKDALAFAYYLRFLSGTSIDSNNIKVFINEDATMDNITDVMKEFVLGDKAKKNDRFIFYFAGHGDIESKIFPGEGLLLLYNAPNGNYFIGRNEEFLSTIRLYNALLRPLIERKVEVILIADACHSAAGKEKLSGGSEGGKVTQAALEGINLSTKIFSCRNNQTSIEGEQFGGGRGLFSYTFLKGLYGFADKDNDGVVSMREIGRYVEDNVPMMADPNHQDPVIVSENPGDVFGKVNKSFFNAYAKDESSNPVFVSSVNYRSKRESWLKTIFSKAKKDYKTCMRLIEDGYVDRAYTFFRDNLAGDSTSTASLQLRRIISEMYQQEAARIIIPLTENISRNMPDRMRVQMAYNDLSRAAELLGPHHYLADYYKARLLFLDVLALDFSSSRTDIPAAIKDLKSAIRLEPTAPYSYFLAGSLYQQTEQFDSAKKYYQFYIDLIPNSSWALNNMGQVCSEMGNDAEALSSYRKAVAIDPFAGRSYNNMGLLLLRQKNCQEAINAFQRSILYWRQSEIPYVNLATAYKEDGQYDKAVETFETANRINPGNEQANLQLGHLYFDKRSYSLAATRFEQALHLNHENKAIRHKLGDAYNALGDLNNTYYNYSIARTVEPDNAALAKKYEPVLFKLAMHRKNVEKNAQGALILLEEYNRLYPKKTGVLNLLAEAAYQNHEYYKSMQYYKQVMDLSKTKTNLPALEGYAQSLFYSGQYQTALANFRKLPPANRQTTEILYNTTCCYAAMKMRKEFFKSLTELLNMGAKHDLLNWMIKSKEYDNMRTDPEFKTMLEKAYPRYDLTSVRYLFQVREAGQDRR